MVLIRISFVTIIIIITIGGTKSSFEAVGRIIPDPFLCPAQRPVVVVVVVVVVVGIVGIVGIVNFIVIVVPPPRNPLPPLLEGL